MGDVPALLRGADAGPTARERFFVECDSEGRVLWMNARARQRLGHTENLLSEMEPRGRSDARRVLSPKTAPGQSRFSCSLRKSDGGNAIPVQFTRLLTRRGSVLLAARVRERVSDVEGSLSSQLALLAAMQHNTSRKYMSLTLAEEKVRRHARLWGRMPSPGAGELLSAEMEEERSRLARDLHAGAGQALVAIKLNVGTLRGELPAASNIVQETLRRIEWLADQALEEVRSASRRLHPPDWQQLGLREALQRLWDGSGIARTFRAALDLQPVPSEVPQAIKVAVYRCAQEGLSNVLRHSGATEVRLLLEERDGWLDLALEDNGRGFDAQRVLSGAAEEPRGIGVGSMRRQVRALNGKFEVRSGPRGTVMKISLPLKEH